MVGLGQVWPSVRGGEVVERESGPQAAAEGPFFATGRTLQPLALGQIGRRAWKLGWLLQPEVNFLGMKAC